MATSSGPRENVRLIKQILVLTKDGTVGVIDPSLNRNLGKFQLPHVWDQILKDTPTLHLK